MSVTIPASLLSSTYRPATKASAKEHAKSAREVVRASARCSQRGVTRTDSDECVRHIDGRNLHDALHHLRHGERGKPVVPMPPLLLDQEQSRRAQLREMTASYCGVIPATDANSEAVSARRSIRAWSIAARVASKPEMMRKAGSAGHGRPRLLRFEGDRNLWAAQAVSILTQYSRHSADH